MGSKTKRPPYINMIQNAITNLKQGKGYTGKNILKYICDKYSIENKKATKRSFGIALMKGVGNDVLIQRKGHGVSAIYTLGGRTKAKSSKFKVTKSDIKPLKSTKGSAPKAKPNYKFEVACKVRKSDRKPLKSTKGSTLEAKANNILEESCQIIKFDRKPLKSRKGSTRKPNNKLSQPCKGTKAERKPLRSTKRSSQNAKSSNTLIESSKVKKSDRTRLHCSKGRTRKAKPNNKCKELSSVTKSDRKILKSTKEITPIAILKKTDWVSGKDTKSGRIAGSKPSEVTKQKPTKSKETKKKSVSKVHEVVHVHREDVKPLEETSASLEEVIHNKQSCSETSGSLYTQEIAHFFKRFSKTSQYDQEMAQTQSRGRGAETDSHTAARTQMNSSKVTDIKISGNDPLCVKLPGDEDDCEISGLGCTPDGRILVADSGNGKIKMFDQSGLCLAVHILHGLVGSNTPLSVVNNEEAHFVLTKNIGISLYINDIKDNRISVKERILLNDMTQIYSIASCDDKIVVIGAVDFANTTVKFMNKTGEIYWADRCIRNQDFPMSCACYLETARPVVIIADSVERKILKLDLGTGEILNFHRDEEEPSAVCVDANRSVLYIGKRSDRQISAFSCDFINDREILTQDDGICHYPRCLAFNPTNNQLLVAKECVLEEANFVDRFQIFYG